MDDSLIKVVLEADSIYRHKEHRFSSSKTSSYSMPSHMAYDGVDKVGSDKMVVGQTEGSKHSTGMLDEGPLGAYCGEVVGPLRDADAMCCKSIEVGVSLTMMRDRGNVVVVRE